MDPEIDARVSQYEMAYRMQAAVPQAMDLKDEPDAIFDLYGADARKPGTFAANCLLARRLAERNVRFIQLYHQGWDQHGNLPPDIKIMTNSVDRASAALVIDLKQRGLLDDTLVICGAASSAARTTRRAKLTKDNYGRDHHPRCFTIWMAGAGVKKGFSYGETDEFGYNIVRDPVHVHDFQATLLYLLGIDHEKAAVQAPGTPLSADRRPRTGGEGSACVNELTLFLGRFHPLLVHFPIVSVAPRGRPRGARLVGVPFFTRTRS